jgi:glutathione synthase/RimK-type ligase-like ATP-grasp enzyme
MHAEDIVRANTRCAAKAADAMHLPWRVIDDFGNIVEITINRKRYYFVHARTPFNTESISSICFNKYFTYQLLKHELPMPLTKSYVDPKAVGENARYRSFKTQDEIVKDIWKTFERKPVIVKMNTGAQGMNVFLCKTQAEVRKAVKAIFNKRHKKYDFSLLAQECLDIKREFRAIVFKGKVLMVYEKVTSKKTKNLSPLHNDDGKAVIVEDKEIIKKIKAIVTGSPRLKNRFAWNGLDIAYDGKDRWSVIELNAHPGFTYFVKDNSDEPLVKVYKKTLKYLTEKGK